MKIKSFKMRVTPEQSEQVQRILFNNGCEWRLNFTAGEPQFTDSDFVFLTNGIITHGLYDDGNDFTNDPKPELTFDQFMNLYGSEANSEN